MNERYLVDRFMSAEFEEMLSSDNHLLSDLSLLFSPDSISQGFEVGFDGDRTAFESAINVINLSGLIESGQVHIHSGTIETLGFISILGDSVDSLAQLPLVQALDVLQSYRWKTFKDKLGIFNHLDVTYDEIKSRLIIANSTHNPKGELVADITKPGISLTSTYRYLPASENEFIDDFFDGTKHIANTIQELRATKLDEKIVGKLAIFLKNNKLNLIMPQAKYYMAVGRLGLDLYSGLNVVGNGYLNRYEISEGRVVKIDDPFSSD